MRRPSISAENVGLLTHGDVHAQTLVLNVGGQPHPLCEISSDKLRDHRQVVMKAIAYRTKLAFVPRLIMCVLVLWLWWNIPTALLRGEGMNQGELLLAAVIMAGCSVIAAWSVVHLNMGAWARRHRRAIAELESVLAKLDAELDMRRPLEDFSTWALLRTLFPPVRFRSFHQPTGDI
jgi:hypothetical protein